MSVGDIKGSRRRFKLRQQRGEAPKQAGLSVSELVAKNRDKAARMANAGTKRVK